MYNVKVGAMNAYLELTKPRVTWLILMSAGIGYFFGARLSGATLSTAHGWHWLTLLHTILGTGLIASGTAALNQWIEREADAKMRRTQARPLPSGRLQARNAFLFGIAISLAGFLELTVGVNRLTGLLGLITMALYLLVYTPLKQVSPHSTTLGAIPGAMPPLIGYAAASGKLDADALILFAIVFLWQFPHFYAIAWMYREDYERAGILMLPVVEPDGESTARQIFLYSVILLPISLVPSLFAMTGTLYMAGALAVGSYYVYMSTRVRFQRTRQQARRVLFASIVYLPVLYGLMLIDHVA